MYHPFGNRISDRLSGGWIFGHARAWRSSEVKRAVIIAASSATVVVWLAVAAIGLIQVKFLRAENRLLRAEVARLEATIRSLEKVEVPAWVTRVQRSTEDKLHARQDEERPRPQLAKDR
jgi:hypothetical protein